uniref:o-succinylbenzoate synthase n=1 Tax=Schlesneria paludicola TaxID=360056 RepID=A0A7C2JXN8_9PLAN
MVIDRIDLFHVAMPLKHPWRTAYGEDAAVEAVLCRLSSGSLDAWGEASPFAAPCYSREWAGGVFAVCRDWLAPRIVHQDVTSGEDLRQRLSVFKGNPFAKAALDTAWWSLESKRTGQPLHRLLGGTRNEVAVGADFGVLDSLDELLAGVAKAAEQRFRRIKLKFRPGWDRDMVLAVRSAFPNLTTHIDCNSGYSLDDLELFRWLDDQGLAMIEQPLRYDDLLDHATLQKQIATPVCLDESLASLHHARQAIQLNSCRYANIKPGRVGGLTVARQMHDLFREAGIPCWVGGMLESATGASHCLALATLDNFTYPADLFPSSRFYAEDLSDPPLELSRDAEGHPSLRVREVLSEPVPTRLAKRTLQAATIT